MLPGSAISGEVLETSGCVTATLSTALVSVVCLSECSAEARLRMPNTMTISSTTATTPTMIQTARGTPRRAATAGCALTSDGGIAAGEVAMWTGAFIV